MVFLLAVLWCLGAILTEWAHVSGKRINFGPTARTTPSEMAVILVAWPIGLVVAIVIHCQRGK